ncbi:protein kinase [Corynebacterium sp. zg912]|uniref:non-specific serine/threonine protein kinase n=1 Tax=Corynebacterium wankanglinii TaxID=2735136 RepID=A0A7H0K946_9CORY|nr:serine/threonine protein kinase [Corynebacterium wankanglinii]MCR5928243.1 protein kinase [Corynebacterium sp. zg912]QNP93812.1 serine/threonine protein kinase [Corynebacterium wankanglinii]
MASLSAGTTLDGRYVVDRPIARGGMATVYRCVDARLGREVAAKVMHEQFVHDDVFRDRFRREARAMAQLSHPNLVNVYDFSASGGEVFLIMELITGGTLRELLAERGPMPPHAAAAVMRGMLTGLSVAHAKGMVHRDIKPDNVLIDASSRVKLSDFGLVRAAAETPQSTDQIVGTVAYLSPEQVDGSPITAASDVYSAGIVLFELLTGRTPFSGDTPLAHAYARLRADVPAPSSLIAGVPKLFDELVATATARNPRDRFHDASDFLAALDDVARELRLPAYTVPVPRNSAAHRAAEFPTNFGLAAGATASAASAGSARAAQQRLFPGDDAPTRVSPAAARPAQPAPTPSRGQWPAAAPGRGPAPVPAPAPQPRPQRPAGKPVSNRSAIGVALYTVVVIVVVVAVGLGAWWFGSGMYGEIPEIIVPRA